MNQPRSEAAFQKVLQLQDRSGKKDRIKQKIMDLVATANANAGELEKASDKPARLLVHRDRPTSGVLLFSLDRETARQLTQQLSTI